MDASGPGSQWMPSAADLDYSYDDNDQDGDNDIGGNDGDPNDSRDPKRRRIARACDMCRKKKIKCVCLLLLLDTAWLLTRFRGALLTPAEMEAMTESWRPYRSLGMHLALSLWDYAY